MDGSKPRPETIYVVEYATGGETREPDGSNLVNVAIGTGPEIAGGYAIMRKKLRPMMAALAANLAAKAGDGEGLDTGPLDRIAGRTFRRTLARRTLASRAALQLDGGDAAVVALMKSMETHRVPGSSTYRLPAEVFEAVSALASPWDGTDSFELGLKPPRVVQATETTTPVSRGLGSALVKRKSRQDAKG